MAVLARVPFLHHFFNQILMKIRGLRDSKNVDNTCEGWLKSSSRLHYIFLCIFGTTLEVTLEVKMHSKSHCDSLWAPSVGIFFPIWADTKKHENSGPRGGLKSDLGGMGACGVARA